MHPAPLPDPSDPMSESVLTEPPPTAPAEPGRLNDFSDRLSPMLVKELRQGLRARTFVSVFLSLQILLAMFLLAGAGLGTHSPENAGRFISKTIFILFSLAVLVIQPLRGVGTLHQEIKDRTLELVALTRLNAWRIVLGKWFSIVSQSALLFVAIVPYLILRYWFGDMNLFGELVALGLVLIASAALTAMTVGLSAVPAMLLRGLLPLIGILFLSFLIFQLAFTPFGGLSSLIEACTMTTPEARLGIACFLGLSTYVAWNALGISVSMIAPAAENHSTVRRLITLVLLAGCAAVAMLPGTRDWAISLVTAIVTVPVLILSLSEDFRLLPSVCRPFVRFGNAGRIAGLFLYPGWPSAALFLIPVALLVALILGNIHLTDPEEIAVTIALAGMLIFPAAVVGLFRRFGERRFVGYTIILSLSLIASFLLQLLVESMNRGAEDLLWFFVWLPPVLLLVIGENLAAPGTDLTVAAAVTGGYALLLLVQALRKVPEIRRVEHQTLAATAPPAP